MNFRNIILAYFVIATVMFGGGAIQWDDAGMAKWFINDPGEDIGVDDQASAKLEGVGGAIQSVVDAFGGPLILVWNLVVGLISYLHWPVTVLATNNAPPRVTLLLGGSFVVAFYMSLLGLVMSGS